MRLADVSPATASFFRCGYAVPPLVALAVLERQRLGTRSRHSHGLAGAAGVLLGANFLLLNTAIPLVGAGIATVVGNLQVLVVAWLGWLFFAERPSPRVLLVLPVALAGVVLISGALQGDPYGASPGAGTLVSIGTSLAYAGYMLVMRQSQRRGDPHVAGPLLEATAVSTVTCAVLAPLAGGIDLAPSWPAHGWLLLSAFGPQVLGWMLITTAMSRLPVALTAVLLLLQPAVAVLLAGAVLAERPSPLQLLGCVVLLAGAVHAARAPSRPPEPPAATPDERNARVP